MFPINYLLYEGRGEIDEDLTIKVKKRIIFKTPKFNYIHCIKFISVGTLKSQ
jgi:hypothetical protein